MKKINFDKKDYVKKSYASVSKVNQYAKKPMTVLMRPMQLFLLKIIINVEALIIESGVDLINKFAEPDEEEKKKK